MPTPICLLLQIEKINAIGKNAVGWYPALTVYNGHNCGYITHVIILHIIAWCIIIFIHHYYFPFPSST